ncbi:MAG: hypothetical protein ABI330_14275 [Caldimonas sp.]
MARCSLALAAGVIAAGSLMSCGGGSTGSDQNSGTNKTFLSVDASDTDGDSLHYQWRVTAGTIDNKDSPQTVWTMPDGPGLHFAYVAISDGKGGWTEQQYSASSDLLDTTAATPAPVDYAAPAVADIDGSMSRLRFSSSDVTMFTPPGGGTGQSRIVYLPSVQVQLVAQATGAVAFAGQTDLAGELDLPKLPAGIGYNVLCSTQADAPMTLCGAVTGASTASVHGLSPALGGARNLRLFGHVMLADGGVCGHENPFFGILTSAMVQLRQADGTAIGNAVPVNRYGDYEIDASVPVNAALKAEIVCEGNDETLAVPASTNPAGYVGSAPIELSHVIANSRPVVVKMVGNGADGNVRGTMVVPIDNSASTALPGADHFLIYKGADTKLGACQYYTALGAAQGCDAQGNMISPISFDDWKTKTGFGTSADVSAIYVNQRDLNLVRNMVATKSSSGSISFYVCNSPGPAGLAQAEVDLDIDNNVRGLNRIACVAMEYSTTTGVNGGLPFTKFLTFGPAGQLLLSINLDTRGEKFMPGSCIACHGGLTYNGKFPELPNSSAYLGSRFLPFDTGNYLLSSVSTLTESAQGEAFYQLNQLVRATEPSDTTPTSALIQGWYAGSHTLDKTYVPPAWLTADADANTPGAATFYRNVVGISCRTCHVALEPSKYDWNSIILSPARASTQFCGGTADVALNASMPNALISNDRLAQHLSADSSLAAVVTRFLGCTAPLPDPVYPKR